MENQGTGQSQTKMFVLGAVGGVVVLCAIGFFVLLGIMLKGGGVKAGVNNDTISGAVDNPSAPAVVKSKAPAVDEKNDHIIGGKNAKVTLIEYSDFECPFCGAFFPTVKQALAEYGDKIRFVYRHFPLSFHPQAQPAAEASECAAEQGKFWEFHDGLFANQDSLGDALYNELAQDLGLSAGQFQTCRDSGKYRSKVQQQMAGGTAAGVNGTPHTIIMDEDGNAVPVNGAQPYTALKAAIDSML